MNLWKVCNSHDCDGGLRPMGGLHLFESFEGWEASKGRHVKTKTHARRVKILPMSCPRKSCPQKHCADEGGVHHWPCTNATRLRYWPAEEDSKEVSAVVGTVVADGSGANVRCGRCLFLCSESPSELQPKKRTRIACVSRWCCRRTTAAGMLTGAAILVRSEAIGP